MLSMLCERNGNVQRTLFPSYMSLKQYFTSWAGYIIIYVSIYSVIYSLISLFLLTGNKWRLPLNFIYCVKFQTQTRFLQIDIKSHTYVYSILVFKSTLSCVSLGERGDSGETGPAVPPHRVQHSDAGL